MTAIEIEDLPIVVADDTPAWDDTVAAVGGCPLEDEGAGQ